jgi:hypothetical protein
MSLKKDIRNWYDEDNPPPPPAPRTGFAGFMSRYWYVPLALVLFAIAAAWSLFRIDTGEFTLDGTYRAPSVPLSLFYLCIFELSLAACALLAAGLLRMGLPASPFARLMLSAFIFDLFIAFSVLSGMDEFQHTFRESMHNVELYTWGVTAGIMGLQAIWLFLQLTRANRDKRNINSTVKILGVSFYGAFLFAVMFYCLFLVWFIIELRNTLEQIGPINFMPRC